MARRRGTNKWHRNWGAYCGKLTQNSTVHGIMQAPVAEFSQVRFLMRNHIISAQPQLTRLLAAVTNTAASTTQKIVPSVGNTVTNNGATGWLEVQFNGVANPILSQVINPAVSGIADVAFDGSYDFSDWLNLKSLAPVDALGNGNPYLMWRCYVPSPYTWWPLSSNSTDRQREDYLEIFTNSGSGAVTTPEGVTSGTAAAFMNMAGVEFIQPGNRDQHPLILALGDSITQGYATSTSFRSWCYMVEKVMKAAGVPISFANYGWVGTPTGSYAAYGRTAVDIIKPTHVLYSAFSPNNTPVTQASFDAQFADALAFDAFCDSRNVQCIFTFLLPDNYFNATQDALRKAFIQKIKDRFPGRVWDATEQTGDNANPQKIITTYHAGDNLHYNTAGSDTMGQSGGVFLLNYLAQAA